MSEQGSFPFEASKALDEFQILYEFVPVRDNKERMAQAWELILALILEEYEREQMQAQGETC